MKLFYIAPQLLALVTYGLAMPLEAYEDLDNATSTNLFSRMSPSELDQLTTRSADGCHKESKSSKSIASLLENYHKLTIMLQQRIALGTTAGSSRPLISMML
jgi:hypothetical protein